ncbi:MAG: response regulator [bacterium]|nr:response regulator [bacterium]
MEETKTKKILIVEDDPAIAQLYETELTLKGLEVVLAVDGAEGLEKAKTAKPDLILLDVMMPNVSGIDMLKSLKKDENLKNITVVMLTNFGQENLIQEAFALGIQGYILKYRVTPAELYDKIAILLGLVKSEWSS